MKMKWKVAFLWKSDYLCMILYDAALEFIYGRNINVFRTWSVWVKSHVSDLMLCQGFLLPLQLLKHSNGPFSIFPYSFSRLVMDATWNTWASRLFEEDFPVHPVLQVFFFIPNPISFLHQIIPNYKISVFLS